MDTPPQRPACTTARFGDDAHPATSFAYFQGYRGQRVYPFRNGSVSLQLPLSGYETEAERLVEVQAVLGDPVAQNKTKAVSVVCTSPANIGDHTAELLDTGEDLLPCPFPYVAHPRPGTGDPPCVLPCVLPSYSDQDIRNMWYAYVIPGIAGLVLCGIHVGTSLAGGIMRKRKQETPFTLIYCSLGVAFACIDTITVAVLYTDLPCPGDTILKKGESFPCVLNRLSVCLLMSIYYWVTFHVIFMYLRVIESEKFLLYKARLFHVLRGACVLVPLVCATMVVALDVGYEDHTHSEESSLYWAEYARDVFTCSPRFDSLWQEFLFVDLHFFLCSTVILVLLARMIKYIKNIVNTRNLSQDSSLSQMRPTPFSFSLSDDTRTCPWLFRCWRLLSEVVLTCPRIFTLSLFMSLLLAIHFMLAVFLIPQWDEFGDSSSVWIACKRIEEACVEVEASVGTVAQCNGHRECGAFPEARPSTALLELFYFCRSSIVLFIGATFSFTTSNFKALRVKWRGAGSAVARHLRKNSAPHSGHGHQSSSKSGQHTKDGSGSKAIHAVSFTGKATSSHARAYTCSSLSSSGKSSPTPPATRRSTRSSSNGNHHRGSSGSTVAGDDSWELSGVGSSSNKSLLPGGASSTRTQQLSDAHAHSESDPAPLLRGWGN